MCTLMSVGLSFYILITVDRTVPISLSSTRMLTILGNVPHITYAALAIFVTGIACLEFARAKHGGPIAVQKQFRNAQLYINLLVFFAYFSLLFSIILADRLGLLLFLFVIPLTACFSMIPVYLSSKSLLVQISGTGLFVCLAAAFPTIALKDPSIFLNLGIAISIVIVPPVLTAHYLNKVFATRYFIVKKAEVI